MELNVFEKEIRRISWGGGVARVQQGCEDVPGKDGENFKIENIMK